MFLLLVIGDWYVLINCLVLVLFIQFVVFVSSMKHIALVRTLQRTLQNTPECRPKRACVHCTPIGARETNWTAEAACDLVT